MKPHYLKQTSPFIVPTTDGKTIEEHFGLASTREEKLSIAHMIAPPGWSEPHQCPEFDEYILMARGRKLIEFETDRVILNAGESLLVRKGSRVKYSNPFEDDAEYWSVCLPAFSPATVHRETT